jgi:hypothetical protein
MKGVINMISVALDSKYKKLGMDDKALYGDATALPDGSGPFICGLDIADILVTGGDPSDNVGIIEVYLLGEGENDDDEVIPVYQLCYDGDPISLNQLRSDANDLCKLYKESDLVAKLRSLGFELIS